MRMVAYILAGLLVLVGGVPAAVGQALPSDSSEAAPRDRALAKVSLEQKLDNQVPGELVFTDSRGVDVQLERYFDGDKPVVLALGYVNCPNLCTLVHKAMVDSLEQLSMRMGEDYRVVSVSLDPDEPLQLTRSARQRYLQQYGKEGAGDGWHSLVGDKESIERLADAVGFGYAYDAGQDQYAHPGLLTILTPQGKVSRYLYGVQYPPADLRLALLDASEGSIGSPVDQVLMRCFHYDPATGKYSVAILEVMRMAGGVTVVVIAVGLLFAFSRGRWRRTTDSEEG